MAQKSADGIALEFGIDSVGYDASTAVRYLHHGV